MSWGFDSHFFFGLSSKKTNPAALTSYRILTYDSLIIFAYVRCTVSSSPGALWSRRDHAPLLMRVQRYVIFFEIRGFQTEKISV